MDIGVTIRTSVEFEDLEDINDAYDIICSEMTVEEVLDLAREQGNAINVDVEEY